MIAWVGRLLDSWAECVRLGESDVAGIGYPSGSGPVVVAELSRARRSGADKRTAAVLRAGLSAGVTAHAVASRPSRVVNRAPMLGDVERLDRFISAELSEAERTLLEVFYVDVFHTADEKAGRLGCSRSGMFAKISELHVVIDRFFRPSAAVRDEAALSSAELDRLLAALSG
ncbi:hypothetical protein [Zhongshania marina]|uniref:Uncharacterized protein n=1 Tax=Zhongshania marina TaxID=2304603 RepID=A0A2S4HGL0_9GAMM|nr:hypothetical protein [Marortus luteolus]POP53079.1 hypothetical protein C0068_08285 [Marortus luteolus]